MSIRRFNKSRNAAPAKVAAPESTVRVGVSRHNAPPAKGDPSKYGVNTYDDEMAELARKSAKAESASMGGSYISTKGGHFAINKQPIQGDAFQAVILGSVFCNSFYTKPYRDDVLVVPDCYAIAEEETELVPHEKCADPQHEQCKGCPCNRYGTSNTGKGKACKNQRRLAMVLDDGEGALTDAREQIYLLSVPVTSVRGWAQYVAQLAGMIKPRASCGVVTEITIEQIPGKTYSKIVFEFIRELEGDEIETMMGRRSEAMAQLMAPFPDSDIEEGESAPAPRSTLAGRNNAPAPRRAGAPAPSHKFTRPISRR